jgi:hypothetical protein
MGIVVPVDTPVSKETITSLSVKARMTWEELHLWGMALLTFCRMTKATWEFYWYSMAAYPEFKFILLCEGREWKLCQWSINLYSSWTCTIGLQTVKPKTEDLNNSNLIQMDSNNTETDAEDNLPQESDKDNGNMVSQEIEETSIQPISPSTLILYLPF